MACNPKWANSTFALISTTGTLRNKDIPGGHAVIYMAQQIALIHHPMLRSLNSIYNQCLAVKPGMVDAVDLLTYCQVFCEMLQEHDDVEEKIAFPEVEKKLAGKPDLMQSCVEQHEQFEAGLKVFQQYVSTTPKEEYDGHKLSDIIDSFGKTLQEHLHDEIPALLALYYLDSEELMKIWG